MDLITGERYGKLTYFRRLSNGTLTNAGKIQSDGVDIQTANNSWPFVCDYNADGKKDLLVGQEGIGAPCNVYAYLNIGTNSAPVFTDSTPILFAGRPLTYYRTIPVFIDIDVDGKKDMVLGGWYSDVRLYSNSGTNSNPIFTTFTYLVRPDSQNYLNGNPPRVNFTDWDGDGDQDMLTCDYYGSVFLRRNITATGVSDDARYTIQDAKLQIWPNPCRSGSDVRFTIHDTQYRSGSARVQIFDVAGKLVQSLAISHSPSVIGPIALPAGVYTVVLSVGRHTEMERLVVIR